MIKFREIDMDEYILVNKQEMGYYVDSEWISRVFLFCFFLIRIFNLLFYRDSE